MFTTIKNLLVNLLTSAANKLRALFTRKALPTTGVTEETVTEEDIAEPVTDDINDPSVTIYGKIVDGKIVPKSTNSESVPVTPGAAFPWLAKRQSELIAKEMVELDKAIERATGLTTDELADYPVVPKGLFAESREGNNSLDPNLCSDGPSIQWGRKPDHEKLQDVLSLIERGEKLTIQEHEFFTIHNERREKQKAEILGTHRLSELDILLNTGSPAQEQAQEFQPVQPVKTLGADTGSNLLSELEFHAENAPSYIEEQQPEFDHGWDDLSSSNLAQGGWD